MLFQELSINDQHELTCYLECWNEFLLSYRTFADENGRLPLNLFDTQLSDEESIRLRAMASTFRQLCHPSEISGFDRTIEVLDAALDELNLLEEEKIQKQKIFQNVRNHKSKVWKTNYIERQNPKNPSAHLTPQKILDVVHHEYIMHNRELKRCLYKQHYPTLASCPIILDYKHIVQNRVEALRNLAVMVYKYKEGVFFDITISESD